jgi:aldehyde dehydrogenase (NAD+)
MALDALREEYLLLIDGDTVEPEDGSYRDVLDPATNDRLASVAFAGPGDVDAAVDAATTASDAWASTPPAERGEILLALAQEIQAASDQLAEVECLDQGKPISEARSSVEQTVDYFQFYGGAADTITGETHRLGNGQRAFTNREPYGVSAQIVPWNFPMTQLARGVAPALAAGNSVVVKPAEPTCVTALLLGELALDAGIPPGVFNVVPGEGATAGAALTNHDDVDMVTFTGSQRAGTSVMEAAAETFAPVTLELGGKNPAIVCEDADLDRAVEELLLGSFFNSGQVCNSSSRLLLHAAIADEFLDRFTAALERFTIGPGVDDPDIGPMTTREHAEGVAEYPGIAKREGANVTRFGSEVAPEDNYVRPAVFTDVTPDMRVFNEEIFGPMVAITEFESVDEALELANDVEFGLVGGVFSTDLGTVNHVASALDVGQVYVNEWFAGTIKTPFGGMKRSGIGRENGVQALEHYTTTKTVCGTFE